MAAEKQFTKGELTFVKELPEHVEIECPICFLVMLEDPHLTSCCGHHFCGTCIKTVKDTNGVCPYCNKMSFDTLSDKNLLLIRKWVVSGRES